MTFDPFALPLRAVWLAAVGLVVGVVGWRAVREVFPPRRKPSALARTVDDLRDEHERPNGIGA